MKRIIFCLSIIGCTKPVAVSGPDIPKAAWSETYQPLRSDFGYNPEYAKQLYNLPEDFKFYNLDPDKFDGLAKDMLGNFVTMTTMELIVPAPLFILDQFVKGGFETDYRRGFLPSPYDYQNQAQIKVGDTTTKATIPLGMTIGKATHNGHDYLALSCLSCHATIVGTNLVPGVYNTHRDPTIVNTVSRITQVPSNAWISAGLGIRGLLQGEVNLPLDVLDSGDIQVAKSLEQGNNMIFEPIYNHTEGLTNVAHNDASASGVLPLLMGKDMDDWYYSSPTFAEFLARKNLIKRIPVYVPSTWWLARYRGVHTSRRLHDPGDKDGFVALWTAFFSWPPFGNEHTMSWAERKKKMYALEAYMNQIKSPEFPKTIDKDLAEAGYNTYHTEGCSRCHGSFRKSEDKYILDYNIEKSWFPIDKIKVSSDSVRTMSWFFTDTIRKHLLNMSAYIADGGGIKDPGMFIEAPPLVGLWATAPYLHNHSVPNLYQVLNSKVRPDVWEQDRDQFAYDYDNVGIKHKEIVGPYKSSRYIYDTKIPNLGMSNKGHIFGDKLTDFERYAIIEFLKTLTTENVIANPMR